MLLGSTTLNIANMTRIIISLLVAGLLLLLSAISGISSLSSSTSGIATSYFQSYLLRIYVGLMGILLCWLAWSIYRRRIFAWRMVFVLQGLAWINFAVGGAICTAQQYSKPCTRDTMLFAGMLAAVSAPVFIYWGKRWFKQRANFGS